MFNLIQSSFDVSNSYDDSSVYSSHTQDFKKAKQDSETQLTIFIDGRIYSKQKSIHHPIKQNSCLIPLQTLHWRNFWRYTKNETGRNGEHSISISCHLVDVSGLQSLTELKKHRISEERLTLCNVNSTFNKVNSCRS